jgi:hypothetical protein
MAMAKVKLPMETSIEDSTVWKFTQKRQGGENFCLTYLHDTS